MCRLFLLPVQQGAQRALGNPSENCRGITASPVDTHNKSNHTPSSMASSSSSQPNQTPPDDTPETPKRKRGFFVISGLNSFLFLKNPNNFMQIQKADPEGKIFPKKIPNKFWKHFRYSKETGTKSLIVM